MLMVAVYWMGEAGGFFVYDGTVKSLPCLVEDFVFTIQEIILELIITR